MTSVYLSSIWSLHWLLSQKMRFPLVCKCVHLHTRQLCDDASPSMAWNIWLSFPFSWVSSPSLAFFILSPHTFTSLGVLLAGNHCRWHMSWVRPAYVAQCPGFLLWHYIKESTKWDEENKVTSAEHKLLSHISTKPSVRKPWLMLSPSEQPHVWTKIPDTWARPDTTAKHCTMLLLVIRLLTCRGRSTSWSFFFVLPFPIFIVFYECCNLQKS